MCAPRGYVIEQAVGFSELATRHSDTMSGNMVLAFGVPPCHAPVVPKLPPGGALSRGGLRPTGSGRSCSETHVVHRAVSEMVGASEETGGVFDPLGLATDEVSVASTSTKIVLGCWCVGGLWAGRNM